MRISDWSSDVCSSDLWVALADLADRLAARTADDSVWDSTKRDSVDIMPSRKSLTNGFRLALHQIERKMLAIAKQIFVCSGVHRLDIDADIYIEARLFEAEAETAKARE